jgi:hypothetical protein
MKRLIVAAAFVLAATSAAPAQGYAYYGAPYGYGSGYELYDYAPAYTDAYGGYADSYRGGPGPRVGNGTGMGIGAVR